MVLKKWVKNIQTANYNGAQLAKKTTKKKFEKIDKRSVHVIFFDPLVLNT